MKKVFILSICAAMVLSGCDTATGVGAYGGASLGSILGSAIGGISGGPRGSDVGTIVGMAGGAIVGAAVGNASEQAQQEKYRRYQEERDARYSRNYQQRSDVSQNYDESGFDPTNSGDDRITFEPSQGGASTDNGVYTTVKPHTVTPSQSATVDQLAGIAPGYSFKYNSQIEVRNASFVDANGDGVICAGEVCKVTFEIMNRSDVALFDVQPTVIETTGNKHIHVSPGLYVESIAPHKGIRYTATVAADNSLKDGGIVLKVTVAQGNNEITSQVKEFNIATRRK